MATLQAHGREIGRIEFPEMRLAYMADGKILRNRGDGWKLFKKVKPGVDPREAYRLRLAAREDAVRRNPTYGLYIRELTKLAGSLECRARLHMMIEMMPTDPDGIWSELADGYDEMSRKIGRIEIDDLCSVCALYRGAVETAQELRASSAPVAE